MALIISAASGFLIGATIVGVLVTLRGRRRICPDLTAHGLDDVDREEISAEFTAHTASVRRELSKYADALADGDTRLREQLRRVEAGARS